MGYDGLIHNELWEGLTCIDSRNWLTAQTLKHNKSTGTTTHQDELGRLNNVRSCRACCVRLFAIYFHSNIVHTVLPEFVALEASGSRFNTWSFSSTRNHLQLEGTAPRFSQAIFAGFVQSIAPHFSGKFSRNGKRGSSQCISTWWWVHFYFFAQLGGHVADCSVLIASYKPWQTLKRGFQHKAGKRKTLINIYSFFMQKVS